MELLVPGMQVLARAADATYTAGDIVRIGAGGELVGGATNSGTTTANAITVGVQQAAIAGYVVETKVVAKDDDPLTALSSSSDSRLDRTRGTVSYTSASSGTLSPTMVAALKGLVRIEIV